MAQAIPLVFGAVLPWLLVGLGGWLVVQLVQQNGRILLRLEAMEALLGELSRGGRGAVVAEAAPQGLAVGAPAPGFELPDLSGKTRSLAEFHGRRVLLIFFGPQCGFCLQMLPRIAALSVGGGKGGVNGGPVPLVITSGEVAENRRVFREYGVACTVLVQSNVDVAAKYQAFGTPVGYLIDERGAIASELAVGADALFALAGPSAANGQGQGRENGKTHEGNRPLSTSRLLRDGLKAGTPAPDFRLPKVGGGELSLLDYRGRRVLLVFSDPQCGPCDALARRLEEHHRRTSDPQVLMISRRDMESNRKKLAQSGASFPVAVQKNWDTSKDYGMFATPIAYLIDERGVIAADVAAGEEAILALVSAPADRDGAAVGA